MSEAMITAKQINFLRSLAEERVGFDLSTFDIEGWPRMIASREIAYALSLPKRAPVAPAPIAPAPVTVTAVDWSAARAVVAQARIEMHEGMYKAGEHIVRVYKGKQSGRLLVKRVVRTDDGFAFTYLGSVDNLVRGRTVIGAVEVREMSLDEAKQWGTQYGHCCVCAALLSDPKSVAAGIGPICAKKF